MAKRVKKVDNAPPAEQPGSARSMEYVKPKDGIFYTYANSSLIGWTGFDVRIVFSELTDVLPDRYVLEQRVQVTMSWLQAKYLLMDLQLRISEYEKLNGMLSPAKVP